MRILRDVSIAFIAVAFVGCAATTQQADKNFRPPQGNYRLIVMQPDISVGVLTAGGSFEHREDWTEQSRKLVLSAMAAQQARRGGEAKIAATREEAGGDADMVADLVWLHHAVGQAISMHKLGPQALPTKKDKFDWTLGDRAVAYGQATHYDYALFLRAEDSFASGGRVALQALAMVGCGFGVCAMPTGGMQRAFASLVDLKTGQVVWFNTLAASAGDIRTKAGADAMVQQLLKSWDSQQRKPKSRV